MNNYLVFGIGFLAQILFSARLIVQWIISEKAGRVLSPLLFWQLSILASFLLIVYGILRRDIAIVFGQTATYGIYIRNLYYLGYWKKIGKCAQFASISFPLFALFWLLLSSTYNIQALLFNKNIPSLLMLWGVVGQFVFTLRFYLQWFYSEKEKQSLLPIEFWIFSIIGSVMVLSYAISRRDPVLIIGQTFGFVVYIRNIMLWHRQRTQQTKNAYKPKR